MKFCSTARSAFMKASGSKVFQMFHENAAKISTLSYFTADSILVSRMAASKEGLEAGVLGLTSADWQTVSGLIFYAEFGFFMLADRYPVLKKVAGAFTCAGGTALGVSGIGGESQTELLSSAAAIIPAGLALVFEDQLRGISSKMKAGKESLTEKFQSVAKKALNYPVAASLLPQIIGIGMAASSGLSDPQNAHMFPYAVLWAIGSTSLAFVDEGVKELVRGNGDKEKPKPPHI